MKRSRSKWHFKDTEVGKAENNFCFTGATLLLNISTNWQNIFQEELLWKVRGYITRCHQSERYGDMISKCLVLKQKSTAHDLMKNMGMKFYNTCSKIKLEKFFILVFCRK
jgi:hypothetical protein